MAWNRAAVTEVCNPREQGSCGQHGAHLGPVGPRWAPCCPHGSCYQGDFLVYIKATWTRAPNTELIQVHSNIQYKKYANYNRINRAVVRLYTMVYLFWHAEVGGSVESCGINMFGISKCIPMRTKIAMMAGGGGVKVLNTYVELKAWYQELYSLIMLIGIRDML